MRRVRLQLDQIRRDGNTQPRKGLNLDHVKDLMDVLETEADLNPVEVFHDGFSYWLADGFHRYGAYHRSGRKDIPATLHEGDVRQAVLYSITSNAKHAVLKLTREEKRESVVKLLKDEEWRQWSDREIARRAGVSAPTVGAVRKELPICKTLQIPSEDNRDNPQLAEAPSGEIPQIERKVKRGESEYTVQTAKINERRVRDEPKANASQPATEPMALATPADPAPSFDSLTWDESPAPAQVAAPPIRKAVQMPLPRLQPKPERSAFYPVQNALTALWDLGEEEIIAAFRSRENRALNRPGVGGPLEAKAHDLMKMLENCLDKAERDRKTVTV